MNTFKSCIPCVCTGSGRKRVCKEHNTRKLEGWQEVIDMYAEQELQKIEEEKQYKEQLYKQQKEKEMQAMLSSYN